MSSVRNTLFLIYTQTDWSQPTIEAMSQTEQPLSGTLLSLKTQIESLVALRLTQPIETEKLVNIYRTQLTPNLLMLRSKQRSEMEQLESCSEKLKELNRELLNLQEQCDCVIYEGSCLGSEVEGVKQEACKSKSESPMKNGCDSFDPEAIGELDHETRMRLLDEEETKRKTLLDKKNELDEETTKIAQLNAECASQLNEVKPYIKQLLDKVSPTLINTKSE